MQIVANVPSGLNLTPAKKLELKLGSIFYTELYATVTVPYKMYFLVWVWVSRVGVRLSPLETSATVGLLHQPQLMDMMSVEQSVQLLTVETEVLRENLPQCHFVQHKSKMTWSGLELGQQQWEAGDIPIMRLLYAVGANNNSNNNNNKLN
jgi:hypothetical protein